MPDAICVRVFPSREEAQLAKGILEDIDIEAFLLSEAEGDARRDTPAAADQVKLMVAARDAARARSVLRGGSMS
jgi:hypothetical protein